MKWGNIAYYGAMSRLESWYVVKDIGCGERHEISGSNDVQMINPSPTAIPSSGAAWIMYILKIYIQMKMPCLITEIADTHNASSSLC